jgi:CheY-specific phosphatase CheX
MTTQIKMLDVRHFIESHLIDVFETMLQLEAQSVKADILPEFADRITGSVGFGGENVVGAVYFHMPAAFAQKCTCAMLGLELQELSDDAQINDVIGEITNMLAGGLKSALCDSGYLCAVSTPAIIRGSFEIEAPAGVSREFVTFRCLNQSIIAEIHVKYS